MGPLDLCIYNFVCVHIAVNAILIQKLAYYIYVLSYHIYVLTDNTAFVSISLSVYLTAPNECNDISQNSLSFVSHYQFT